MNVEGEISGETTSYNKEPVFDLDSIIFEFEDENTHVETCKHYLSDIGNSGKLKFILDKLLQMPEPMIKEALLQGETFFNKQIMKLWSTGDPSWDHEAKVIKLQVSLTEEKVDYESESKGTYTVKVRNSSNVGKIYEELKDKFKSLLHSELGYVLRYDGNTLENSKLFSDYSIPNGATLQFEGIKRIIEYSVEVKVEGDISGETFPCNKEPVFDIDNIIFQFEDKYDHVEDCMKVLSKFDNSSKRKFIIDELLRMPKPIIEEALLQGESFFEKRITKLWSIADPSWNHEAKVFNLKVSLGEIMKSESDGTYTVKVRNSSKVGNICEELKEKFESWLEYEYVLRYDGNTLENSKLFSDYSIPNQATLELRKVKRIKNYGISIRFESE